LGRRHVKRDADQELVFIGMKPQVCVRCRQLPHALAADSLAAAVMGSMSSNKEHNVSTNRSSKCKLAARACSRCIGASC
jgi:hypothetical protein